MNFAKFLITSFVTEHFWWLLLKIHNTLLTRLKLSTNLYIKVPPCSKYSNKNCLHESAKDFSVMNYGFILFCFHQTLTPVRNHVYHASVNAIRKSLETLADSSRISKSFHKCERCISV